MIKLSFNIRRFYNKNSFCVNKFVDTDYYCFKNTMIFLTTIVPFHTSKFPSNFNGILPSMYVPSILYCVKNYSSKISPKYYFADISLFI